MELRVGYISLFDKLTRPGDNEVVLFQSSQSNTSLTT